RGDQQGPQGAHLPDRRRRRGGRRDRAAPGARRCAARPAPGGLLTAAGRRLEIDRVEGHPPTLVFLHEGLGCVSRWRDFPRAGAEATGCAVLVYSRRGYGRSEPAPPPWPLTFMHDEAREALPDLLAREEIEDAVLVGHSDGASIALIYAAEI